MKLFNVVFLFSLFLCGCRATVSGEAAGQITLRGKTSLSGSANGAIKSSGSANSTGSTNGRANISGKKSATSSWKSTIGLGTAGNWKGSFDSSWSNSWSTRLVSDINISMEKSFDASFKTNSNYSTGFNGNYNSNGKISSSWALGWGTWNETWNSEWDGTWKSEFNSAYSGSGKISGKVTGKVTLKNKTDKTEDSDKDDTPPSVCDFSGSKESPVQQKIPPQVLVENGSNSEMHILKEPMLRVDGTMHLGSIVQVETDRDNKTVISCSNDKTAKIWNLETGRVITTLRPPVEQGNNGRLFSCTISPDGSTAALGGWTSKSGRDGNIYLFDTKTGKMKQRIIGVETVVKTLAFSPDGKILAAGFGEHKGIKIYAVDIKNNDSKIVTGKSYAHTDYGSSVYSIAFDYQNRFATACTDGYVRLYDANLNFINKVHFPDKEPFSVAFSPDGKKLAVAFADEPEVEVVDGYSLKKLYKPNVEGTLRNSNFEQVAFSSDCRYLYAGGSYEKQAGEKWYTVVRKWEQEGQGRYYDFPGSENTISDLLPLNDGTLIVSGAVPDFGRFTQTGQGIFYNIGDSFEFSNKDLLDHLSVNNDGKNITFKPSGGTHLQFDMTERQLRKKEGVFETFKDNNKITSVTEWHLSYAPKVNGIKVPFLKPYELNRSVDVDREGNAVFGAIWSINKVSKDGTILWRTDVPGETYGVKISGDGKTVVAAHGNGEIRWYRMSDGAVLLSLFVHPDGKRWVIWTPDGYYDAAPGADRLAGWHINNGLDKAADFFPLSKFAEQFYRPDVITRVIEQNDVKQAVDFANKEITSKQEALTVAQMLPPVIEINSPENGSKIKTEKVTINYTVRTPSGEKVTAIKAFIDGRPLGNRGVILRTKNSSGQVEIEVPEKDCVISLVAQNRYSSSEPASLQLYWQGKEIEYVTRPNLYVLAIGVSHYTDPSLELAFAAKDASDFTNTVKNQKGGLYGEVSVKTLIDNTALKDNILDGLDWILKKTTPKDVAMVFLAGHGLNDDYGDYYYLPQDADLERLKRTGVTYNDIRTTVSNIAGKALFFVDTCHSGNVLGSRRTAADNNIIINQLSSAENGVVVFASSTGRQVSLEKDSWNNGAFTKALIEGMTGKAAYHGNLITVNMLDLYISERVKELTDGRQTPATAKPNTIADFAVVTR
ncbi:MAG: caspase family protein [Deltaproteobacteria bacterium]|nr:caspase family protein [Deltaproteobacteria bacterium]